MENRRPLSARTSLKIGAITFLVLTTISVFVLFSLPKTYLATTRIEVAKPSGPSLTQEEAVLNHDPYFIQTEFEKIKSSVVLTRAYRELNQNQQLPDFAKVRNTQMDDMAGGQSLVAHLEIRQSRNTSLIEIRYGDQNPEIAAAVANTIARAYAAEAKARSSSDVRIIDVAQPPANAASPNIPLLLVIATILNSMLAIMAGFFASNLFR